MNLTPLSNSADAHLAALRGDFQQQMTPFLKKAGIPAAANFSFASEPVYILTGAGFSLFDPAKHNTGSAHAVYPGVTPREKKYLMNNTAAILTLLLAEGRRVLVHSSTPEITKTLTDLHRYGDRVHVIGGDLSQKENLSVLYEALETMQNQKPINDISMVLYQSFAQSCGDPFKPMYLEKPEEVERAATRRLGFLFNMNAMATDFLMQRGLENLRVVALSALAARRPSFGLLADATDKFINELVLSTTYKELKALTGKNISFYVVDPGITEAGDLYDREGVIRTICQESIADGFPFSDAVLSGQSPLPRMSAQDVAWVAHAMLTTPVGEDPNRDMPVHIKPLLYGGYAPEELHEKFSRAIQISDGHIAIDPNCELPEHIFAPRTQYGSLPDKIKLGEYKRISLCPRGQPF